MCRGSSVQPGCHDLAMAVIEVSGVAFAHPGGTELFRGASFKVRSGAHVALVGQNGVGKSTLLGCIVGDLRPTEGSVRTDAAVAYMPQAIGSDTTCTQSVASRGDTTVRELLVEFARPELRDAARALAGAERANDQSPSAGTGSALAAAVIKWAEVGGYQAEAKWDAACNLVLGQTLDRAGGRPISELSGGERKRLVLESLFASDVPILLLDEPDNFLDIPAKRWLERQIASSQKTILFISHDRELLTEAATAVVTLEVNGCWTHPEGWTTYDDARRARNESMGDALQRWKDEERRLFRFMREMKQRASLNDGNAPRANAAETRWERFVEVGPPPSPPPERTIHVRLEGAGSGKIVLRCDRLELCGLTEPFDLEVHHGERIGVLGPNGTGKSHLLRLLAGDETVGHEGSFRLGARVVPGLFHQTDDVPEHRGRQLLDILSDRDLNEERARAYLGRYGLSGAALREVETLSGGQRARLQVLDLELRGVNLLLLDEPTDNLDLGSAEALEASLDLFDGTVVSVTHDRSFMRSMNRWLIIGDDGSVHEALDLDTALNVVTRDDRYPRSKSGLLPLT
ncbi:MAG TPA: ATP-binding cassette domain-containing protein [Acidimicrobiales bacterium]|nr:ATP-binding cassette domain-containing protein [Acidimicrobiales bacterium]